MIAKEYGAWPTRNILSGGQHPSYDEYNREYKKVRYKSAEEYASRNVKEYHHYSEYNDLTSSNNNSQKTDSNKNSRSSRMRIFQQVICLVAGSTIIVSTYQAMTRQAQAEPATPSSVFQQVEDEPLIPVASVEWIWDDTNESASVKLFDSQGKLIKELPAEIGITTVDPTCNLEGTKTYTATATYNNEEFTDTREETLTPLGHAFDEGKEITLGSGKSAREFECSRCHEKFTFQTEMTEND
jgi:hypothetical protein